MTRITFRATVDESGGEPLYQADVTLRVWADGQTLSLDSIERTPRIDELRQENEAERRDALSSPEWQQWIRGQL